MNNSNAQTEDFLPEKSTSGVTYFRVYEGMVCQTRAKETEGFRKYESISESTKGKIVFVREFDHMNGLITGFEKKDKKTASDKPYVVAQITFTSPSGKKAIMDAPIKGEFVSRFAKSVENMDLSKPVLFRAFLDRRGRTAIYFEQGGAKVDQKYTKEAPNGLPEWKKDPMSDEYDTRDYWAFLFNILKEKALPQITRNAELMEAYPADDEYSGPDDTDEHAERAAIAGEPSSLTQKADDDIPF